MQEGSRLIYIYFYGLCCVQHYLYGLCCVQHYCISNMVVVSCCFPIASTLVHPLFFMRSVWLIFLGFVLFVFVLCLVCTVSLDCSFLIDPSVFPNGYSVRFVSLNINSFLCSILWTIVISFFSSLHCLFRFTVPDYSSSIFKLYCNNGYIIFCEKYQRCINLE